ncbi:MAG: asparagine synthase (glutamine-hydrolyzing) [Pirellulaceae bacterium]
MCGIFATNYRLCEKTVRASLIAMKHRGPDDSGVLISNEVTLGHVRLAVLDLSIAGHQPMSANGLGVHIVFNGEIYNHVDIRNTLGDRYSYLGTSDTETLLYAYIEYGKEFVTRLNGIFGFAIYDTRSNELIVARDPFGVKPLYYYEKEGTFIIASEIKAIIQVPGVDLALRTEAFADYLHYLWSPGEGTPFRYVHKLLPGHLLSIKCPRPGSGTISKFFEIPFEGDYIDASESELADELDDRLCRAVGRQLLSDVPVGFFLSGGLDSSLMVAIARNHFGYCGNCYTIRSIDPISKDGFADDIGFAKKVATDLGVSLHEVDGDFTIENEFETMIWHLDEPQADPAAINVLQIAREARKNGDVVLLSGAGGDDVFSGYRRHQALRFHRLLKFGGILGASSFRAVLSVFDSRLPLIRRIRKMLKGAGMSERRRLLTYFAWTDMELVESLFSSTYRERLANHDPFRILNESLECIPAEESTLNQMLFLEMKHFLADHNLNYTDKMSMALGIESRVPFLDKELVDFSCRLPPKMKLNGCTTKYLLRKVAERYLPNCVVYRSKTGFGAPVRSWVKLGRVDNMIVEYLSRKRLRCDDIFDVDAIERLVRDTRAGKLDGSYAIWSLLAIQVWLERFSRAVAS